MPLLQLELLIIPTVRAILDALNGDGSTLRRWMEQSLRVPDAHARFHNLAVVRAAARLAVYGLHLIDNSHHMVGRTLQRLQVSPYAKDDRAPIFSMGDLYTPSEYAVQHHARFSFGGQLDLWLRSIMDMIWQILVTVPYPPPPKDTTVALSGLPQLLILSTLLDHESRIGLGPSHSDLRYCDNSYQKPPAPFFPFAVALVEALYGSAWDTIGEYIAAGREAPTRWLRPDVPSGATRSEVTIGLDQMDLELPQQLLEILARGGSFLGATDASVSQELNRGNEMVTKHAGGGMVLCGFDKEVWECGAWQDTQVVNTSSDSRIWTKALRIPIKMGCVWTTSTDAELLTLLVFLRCVHAVMSHLIILSDNLGNLQTLDRMFVPGNTKRRALTARDISKLRCPALWLRLCALVEHHSLHMCSTPQGPPGVSEQWESNELFRWMALSVGGALIAWIKGHQPPMHTDETPGPMPCAFGHVLNVAADRAAASGSVQAVPPHLSAYPRARGRQDTLPDADFVIAYPAGGQQFEMVLNGETLNGDPSMLRGIAQRAIRRAMVPAATELGQRPGQLSRCFFGQGVYTPLLCPTVVQCVPVGSRRVDLRESIHALRLGMYQPRWRLGIKGAAACPLCGIASKSSTLHVELDCTHPTMVTSRTELRDLVEAWFTAHEDPGMAAAVQAKYEKAWRTSWGATPPAGAWRSLSRADNFLLGKAEDTRTSTHSMAIRAVPSTYMLGHLRDLGIEAQDRHTRYAELIGMIANWNKDTLDEYGELVGRVDAPL